MLRGYLRAANLLLVLLALQQTSSAIHPGVKISVERQKIKPRSASPSYDEKVRKWLENYDERNDKLLSTYYGARYAWVTNITDENKAKEVAADMELMNYTSKAANDAYSLFDVTQIKDKRLRRAMMIVQRTRTGSTAAEREEIADVQAKLSETYSNAKICPPDLPESCEDDQKLNLVPGIDEIITKSRNETKLKIVWKRWHDVSGRPAKDLFFQAVEKNTEQYKRVGYKTITQRLLQDYETDQPDFRDQLWNMWLEMLPFYEDIHAFVRHRLAQVYGAELISKDGTIPSHLVGNMWGQSWANIYDIVKPFPDAIDERPSVADAMKAAHWTPNKIFHTAENFFRSLGFLKLPSSFWEKSVLERPPDRAVVCHGAAYDIDFNDKRIAICTQLNQEDLGIAHHEMGHVYYFLAYQNLSSVFRDGPNAGFHEAVGDTVFISAGQDSYLKQLGLLPADHVTSEELKINGLMEKALSAFMFLPFGYIVDLWRWNIYDGKVSKAESNDHWWELKEKFQGLHAPVPRSSEDFDPAAKFHVPNFVPYVRYFVARFLQYQFHESLCGENTPDLSECSIHGSKESGERLWKMLSLGTSKPWPEALRVITGTDHLSSRAIVKFFDKLRVWLREENRRNRVCIGWGAKWPVSAKLNGPRCRPEAK